MKNEEKFQQVVKSVEAVKQQYGAQVEEKLAFSESERKRNKLEDKLLILKELEFPITKPTFTFFSPCYGEYIQMKYNRKKRINAVHICFFVTLYEQELKVAFSKAKEEIEIPYTLRGFWKMERAVTFVQELIHLQDECQIILMWEERRIRIKISGKKKKMESYKKISNELNLLKVSGSGTQCCIQYGDKEFNINKQNTKLDIVPLCKLVTIYYVNVQKRIDRYNQKHATDYETKKLEKVEDAFQKFMEKYFVQKIG